MGGKGSGGHNRKPTALKKIEGNAGKRRLNTREPEPAKGAPEMPANLPAGAQKEWERIVPLLEGMGVLTQVDGMALAAYCAAVAQWFAAEEVIGKFGLVIAEARPAGKVLRINPAVRIKSDSLRQMNVFLGQFGLSPSTRSKISTSNGETSDPLGTFLGGSAPGGSVQ